MAINLVKNSKGVYHQEKKFNTQKVFKFTAYIVYITVIVLILVLLLSSCSSRRAFWNSTSTCDLVQKHYVGYK